MTSSSFNLKCHCFQRVVKFWVGKTHNNLKKPTLFAFLFLCCFCVVAPLLLQLPPSLPADIPLTALATSFTWEVNWSFETSPCATGGVKHNP